MKKDKDPLAYTYPEGLFSQGYCPDNKCKMQRVPHSHPDPHTHQFTIPVEWTQTPNEYGLQSLSFNRVTKLRCNNCTEEIDR